MWCAYYRDVSLSVCRLGFSGESGSYYQLPRRLGSRPLLHHGSTLPLRTSYSYEPYVLSLVKHTYQRMSRYYRSRWTEMLSSCQALLIFSYHFPYDISADFRFGHIVRFDESTPLAHVALASPTGLRYLHNMCLVSSDNKVSGVILKPPI